MAFYVYQDASRQWRWRLKAVNGRVIADSGEGYVSRTECINGIRLVQAAAGAPIF